MSRNFIGNCTQIIEDARGTEIIPEVLRLYTIAIEDRRFNRHCGFDIWSICRVLLSVRHGKFYGGASTIGQQFIRTVTGRRERTIARKISEIFLSCWLDKLFSKSEILDAYLSIAYYGPNLKGAAAFSEHFYGKKLFDLKDEELAIVASTLRYPFPGAYSKQWWDKVSTRAKYAQLKLSAYDWVK